MLRGIRGAITVEINEKEAIFAAVEEMLAVLVEKNELHTDEIGAAIFSATPDLDAAFPAAAARRIGWETVPLFGAQEQDVENGLEKCIRVLLLVNTDKPQKEIVHAYLRRAQSLRPDIVKGA